MQDAADRRSLSLKAKCPVVIGCCIAAIFAVTLIPGATPVFDRLQSDYLVSAWHVEDGLPQNTITSITQDPDGYLWVGTFDGLVRFDGFRFTVFDSVNTPELKSSRIVRLDKDRHGRIWIQSEQGDVVQFADRKFTAFTEREGVPVRGLSAVAEDQNGQVWALARMTLGAYRFENARFNLVISSNQVPTGMNDPLGAMFGLVGDSDGDLWGGEVTDLIHIYPGYPERFPVESVPGRVKALGSSRDGGIWVATSDGVRKLRHKRWEAARSSKEELLTASVVLEDRTGQVWVGTWEQGLFRFGPDGTMRHYTFTDEPAPEAVRALFEDSEGNLWVGIQGSGLRRLKEPAFRTYDTRDGLGGSGIRSVTEDSRGNIWIADQAGVERVTPGPTLKVEQMGFTPGLPWSISGSRAGPVYVGTYGRGWYRYDERALTRVTISGETPGTDCIALFEDHSGEMWAGYPDSLVSLTHDSTSTRLVIPREKLQAPAPVRSVAEDRSGRLYAGADGSGVWTRGESGWVHLEGLINERVKALTGDSERGLWISTLNGGLSRFRDGRFFNFSDHGLSLPRLISCILLDDQGYVWMGSTRGIYRASRKELEAFAAAGGGPVSVTRYTQSEGLGTIECTGGRQPVACKAHDGRLWFATAKGLSVVDPAQLHVNPVPPSVLIENLWAVKGQSKTSARQGRAQTADSADSAAAVTLAPETDRVEIEYTGVSFTAPERVRFKYRLQGLDRDWIDAGQGRAALYSHLPPGEFRFQVTACNGDGIWNETGATVAIIMLPRYYQTWWFSLLVASAVAGLLFLGYQIRMRRLREIARLRVRIASDLHDEVGSNLASIALNSELLQDNPSLGLGERKDLAEINRVALQTTQAIREISWFINPEFDTFPEMVERMQEVAASMLSGREHQFVHPETLAAQKLSLEFRRNFLFVFKEILHNVVKHSKATKVEISLSERAGCIELRISDNGQGFDPAATGRGNGLKNLRRRALDVDGSFEIESSPGRGATVCFKARIL